MVSITLNTLTDRFKSFLQQFNSAKMSEPRGRVMYPLVNCIRSSSQSALDKSEGLEDSCNVCFVVLAESPVCCVSGKKTNNNRSHNSYHLLNGLPRKWGSGRNLTFCQGSEGKQGELSSSLSCFHFETVESVKYLFFHSCFHLLMFAFISFIFFVANRLQI